MVAILLSLNVLSLNSWKRMGVYFSTISANSSRLDKMSAISQMIFLDAFWWIRSFLCWLKFHGILFLRIQLTITQPDQRQAINCTNAGLFSIGTSGTNFSEILIKIQTLSFKKMHLKLKISSGNGSHFATLLCIHQPGRSPKVVALFSATNFSSYIIELLQLYDTIQIKWSYA